MKTMLLYLFSLLLLCTVTAAGHHQSYETIYVHTDRCNFCAGDTVWFQVYVMDTRQQAESYSRFVYAELLHDTIRMATEKIKVGEEGFAGFFPLPDSIAPGHYTLRFYTLRSASLPIPRFHYTAACSPALPQTKTPMPSTSPFSPKADTCRQAL